MNESRTFTSDRRRPAGRDDAVVVEGLGLAVGPGGRRVQILDDVSFAVPSGQLFAITGPSGSGKTTLLNLVAGIDRPTEGRIWYRGEPLVGASENGLARWRARNVGIVFQFFHLIPTLTAAENVLLALELGKRFPRRAWRARTSECLSAVGMDRHGGRLPAQLSGGEQQRVAIARALANDAPLIAADEPTGNLDSANAEIVFALLQGLTHRGKTVLYVTHDRDLAVRANSTIDLLDGRIVDRRGSPRAESR